MTKNLQRFTSIGLTVFCLGMGYLMLFISTEVKTFWSWFSCLGFFSVGLGLVFGIVINQLASEE